MIKKVSVKMLNKTKIFTTFVRNYSVPKYGKPGAVKYEKVTYYPRHPDHQDPPITPSKLLMVKLVKPFPGNPYWDKNILTQLGIASKGREPVIVKNTPEICALLWKVKHLVKITPIKLPDPLPNLEDLGASYLHDNGTLYITPKLDPLRVESTDKFENDPKKLESLRIGEKLRLQWMSGNLP
ncbi:hypothetical protein KPH14_010876 [Odynerus spinipes]|uniref:Large ribosomal subunit protein uL30m n=1 Tax=Odynerus spinipes TaxID=1348599 RepID=A0AAD9RH33_9HYME|nr:hypothetical protein KPH14_010876 [Odynerus spinipes]